MDPAFRIWSILAPVMLALMCSWTLDMGMGLSATGWLALFGGLPIAAVAYAASVFVVGWRDMQ